MVFGLYKIKKGITKKEEGLRLKNGRKRLGKAVLPRRLLLISYLGYVKIIINNDN
jgi:hypothetical protein